jgi:CBS-domain-containing membrane protein
MKQDTAPIIQTDLESMQMDSRMQALIRQRRELTYGNVMHIEAVAKLIDQYADEKVRGALKESLRKRMQW